MSVCVCGYMHADTEKYTNTWSNNKATFFLISVAVSNVPSVQNLQCSIGRKIETQYPYPHL